MILEEKEEEKIKYKSFFEYFEKNWVGIYDNEQLLIKEPRVQIEFWNAYLRIKENLPRTSNAAESWNRTINLRTEVAHPNIAQFLNELLSGEEAHRYIIRRAEKGIYTMIKEDTVRERSISICIDNFYVYKPFDYLKIIGKYYKFKLED